MKVLAAALLALAFPGLAAAALEVKLSVATASPRAGSRAIVELRPYWTEYRPDGNCCRLKPANVTYPFRVQAVSPAGRVFRVVVRQTANRYLWRGSFVFSRAGRWTLRAPQWGPAYSRNFGARPIVRVLVR